MGNAGRLREGRSNRKAGRSFSRGHIVSRTSVSKRKCARQKEVVCHRRVALPACQLAHQRRQNVAVFSRSKSPVWHVLCTYQSQSHLLVLFGQSIWCARSLFALICRVSSYT